MRMLAFQIRRVAIDAAFLHLIVCGTDIMAYERPPEPGTYYIKSVAAPRNVIEVPSYNDERAVCSPRATEPAPNQLWYIQRSGRGYKIKNVGRGVYLSSYSTKPKDATPVGTSWGHGPVDWYLIRTHDGFAIQYGEDEKAIDLHHGMDKGGDPMHLWITSPQLTQQRWKFERIGFVIPTCMLKDPFTHKPSDDVGGEVAETVEDRITVLRDQLWEKDIEITNKDAEITAKNRLLVRKEQELQAALQGHREVALEVIQTQLAEMRERMEGLGSLVNFIKRQSALTSAPFYTLVTAPRTDIMAYERTPEPGTYYIRSVVAPKNVIEILDCNQERAACSPQATEHTSNQKWYIQRSGRGYKIKNVKRGVYLAPHSAQPTHGTIVGTSPSHGPADWNFMRTHDGFAIQYGDEDLSISLHYGMDKPGTPMLLWNVTPQDSFKRWKFDRIGDEVGGEVAETVEDRIAALTDKLREKEKEIAAKDRLLAQKGQELRAALQSHHEVPRRMLTIGSQLAELRDEIEGLMSLVGPRGTIQSNEIMPTDHGY
ncbi:unnamed protein product [Rhizoctonia solani]|uniref:Ricin B lectin domain-containing protein n=1 Tax=Rhizoctonia solani TaxID=456999 RepID=A0A8H3H688_9AGAM|nr:unnamed protein product [Rhizoctonia solani]